MVKDSPQGEGAMNVGGRRRAAGKRAPLAKKEEGAAAQTKMNFNSDGEGLKVGPVTVLVMSLSFMVIVVTLHILAKFRSAMREWVEI